MSKLGMIGLGKMGGGIAGILAKSAHELMVYDLRPEAAGTFKGTAEIASNLEELLHFSEVVFLSLPSSVEVESVVEDFLSSGLKGKIIVDLSTSFPSSTEKLYKKVKDAGGDFLDCPLLGGPPQAREGKLKITAGGDEEVFKCISPLLELFAEKIFYIGGPGMGNVVKLATNYLSIMYIPLYAELFPFLEKRGVDAKKFFDIIGYCGSNCGVFQLYGKKMVEQDYYHSFAIDLALKDLAYLKRLFDQAGNMEGDLLSRGKELFERASAAGLGKKDCSEIARIRRSELGLKGA